MKILLSSSSVVTIAAILCLLALLFLVLVSVHPSVHAFSASSSNYVSRAKRKQRAQISQQPWSNLDSDRDRDSHMKQQQSFSFSSSSLFHDDVDRERLWELAGQSSRRKRLRQRQRRGTRKQAMAQREDKETLTIYSSSSLEQPCDEIQPDGIQPEDIQRVQILVPPHASYNNSNNNNEDGSIIRQYSHTILAKITFMNDTMTIVNPQMLHQRSNRAIWMATRHRMDVTASELSSLTHTSYFTSRSTLGQIKAGLLERTTMGNIKACEWGLKMEPKALRQYCHVTGNHVTETGLHIRTIQKHNDNNTNINDDNTILYLGASPDGLVVDVQDGSHGLLEIKSLWGRRHKSSLPQFDHCPQRFWDQIQGQMAICNLDWCDLMLYIPPNNNNNHNHKNHKNKSGRNYCILRIPRNHTYWEKTLLPEIQSFCKEVEHLSTTSQ